MSNITIRYQFVSLDQGRKPDYHLNDEHVVCGIHYTPNAFPPALESVPPLAPPNEYGLKFVMWTSSDHATPMAQSNDRHIPLVPSLPCHDLLYTGIYRLTGGDGHPMHPVHATIRALDVERGALIPEDCIVSASPAGDLQADRTIVTENEAVTVNFKPHIDYWVRIGFSTFYQVRKYFVGCSVDPAVSNPSGVFLPKETAGHVVALYGKGELLGQPQIVPQIVEGPGRVNPGDPVEQLRMDLTRTGQILIGAEVERARQKLIASLEASLKQLRH